MASISIATNVELDAVQHEGFVHRAWWQVSVSGSAFQPFVKAFRH